MEVFLKFFPECKESIVMTNLATPLTYEKYLGRFSAYGLQLEKERLHDQSTFLKFDTTVKNLYLAGEDTFMPGI